MKLLPFAIAVALSGCGSAPPASTRPATRGPEPPAVAANPAPASTPAAAPANRKPEFGAWGFDIDGMDRSVPPGDDFYRYANGHWVATTQIPPDKPLYAMFLALADRSDERTREIVEHASGEPGTDGQKIADYYKSYMDEAAIEANGIAPLQPELDRIAAIKDVRGVVLALAAHARHRINTPLFVGINQDDRDPEHYIAILRQGGLGLPDRDMYDPKAVQFAAMRDGYKKYVATMFTLIRLKNASRRAAGVYALEEKIAKGHWTRVQSRDPQKTYNKMTITELQRLAPGIDWKPWLQAVGLESQTAVNVTQPSAIATAAQLIKSQPVAVWKDYLTLQLLTGAADELPKRFVDTQFEMYGKTLAGTPQIQDRWKRAVGEISGVLGDAIGKIYVTKHFTPETKARADQLVRNLLAAMGQRLDNLAWMGPETKAKAKAKLATYNPKIGYPKRWRDYSALTVVAGDPLGNAFRAVEFDYNRQLAKLGKPLDRDEWDVTPMTADAYYNPTLNEIVFPAAILQPPFFDANADDAVNYGGIGAVIGHEISHGFDDQGAQYDAAGVLKNWWTKEDADKFSAAKQKLIAQYSAYCPIPAAGGKPAQCIKGELTLGENIADLAGVTVAYTAYQISLGGKPAPVLGGFTGDQRFFLGFAQVWRGRYREQELASRLIIDSHSPLEFRPYTVRNLDAWYDAFKPKPTDALYLAPDQRVKVW